MQKHISVVTQNGELMESTYPKRAKQLVKLNRAKWIDASTICLLENQTECMYMEYNSNGPNPAYDSESKIDFTKMEPKGAVPVYENRFTDAELYEMAKKKVQNKSALFIHTFAYISVNIFLFFIAILVSGDMWNLYVLGGWGIGLACHAASYFFSVTPDSIQNEFLKQKSKYRE